MRMFTEVGHGAPAHSTGVGKVILAQLPDDQVSRILRTAGLPRATERTITDDGQLRSALDRIRGVGYGHGRQRSRRNCSASWTDQRPVGRQHQICCPFS
jgi:DNA-binding IclR family transcriptional regulator